VKVPACIRIIGMSMNFRESISALATNKVSMHMLNLFIEIIVAAVKQVSQGIIDVEVNETSKTVELHGINFDQYLPKKSAELEKTGREIHV
jgi:hypothetical protein